MNLEELFAKEYQELKQICKDQEHLIADLQKHIKRQDEVINNIKKILKINTYDRNKTYISFENIYKEYDKELFVYLVNALGIEIKEEQDNE